MFRLLAISATSLTMLFHGVFGCCWHHVHSVKRDAIAQFSHEDRDCDTHEHHDETLHIHSRVGPCSQHGSDVPCCPDGSRKNCSEGFCVYVSPGLTRSGCVAPDLTQVTSFVGAHVLVSVLMVQGFSRIHFESTSVLEPGPRARTQVWIV